ncbi:exodeoxyribonuclease V subunit gamma [Sphaerotilus microaerophilus]|uniref:exodeoxyribonuclease V subunit gamma n=1 Tax=Sphaerotilus microaerophilus TaxID=2914710 RepID=UPI002073FBAB|nr:exodeoxyribonuclease V subunit gamma [Sphaerotilus sp. FB-5]
MPLTPGLLVLHGNRLEWLLDTVLAWLQAQPLAPLETETVLVQSNGIAEWLKMSLAARAGVCAATRVELPARFLWRLYRATLGRAGAPARSPLDEAPLAWRLMRLLPALVAEPGYEPLAQFLQPAGADASAHAGPDLSRRWQLAQRLADLYDQYQVYRADWLQAWGAGRDELIGPGGQCSPLPEDQRWQARLWRAVGAELDEAERLGVRSEVHARCVAALHGGERPAAALPRRVVVFGVSHLPAQTLQALAALARHAQVILAVPNPCRYHWADIIEGRELLARPQPLRHPHRGGIDLAQLPLEEAHAQANPLLAAWGRQARDFVRLLDHFDETEAVARQLALPRVDLFDDGPGVTLLQQVQARIRDNAPLDEHAGMAAELPAGDRSIVFHLAHSAMREVEILHDQLLDLLALRTGPADPNAGKRLAPRDIVVMLPDIEPWAPLIHAVFGRHAAGDPRRIPYEIADLRARGRRPLLLALEWLLRLDTQRCTAGELRDLLDVPALARRFGLDEAGRAIAARWLAGAGVRWGLDEAHRASLGLGECGEVNTWAFGLQRMLAGYAVGPADEAAADAGVGAGGGVWQGIEPYDEVGGLDAAVAGSLAALVDALRCWWQTARIDATPADWDTRCRALLGAFFEPADEDERLLLGALAEALGRWREDAEAAGYTDELPLAVLREAWLAGVDEPGLRSRFLAGGVVFCTLMPMRAIPFEVVCLLGMNDGDYPRRSPRADFDLIAQPSQRRPGDRARRDDDRLLMLEALLSARRQLYVSWAGRSARDNTAQPPSVLVAQLRDYLAAGWGAARLAALTTEHPLQPFSRRYFEAGTDVEGEAEGEARAAAPRLFTYASEWRVAHAAAGAEAGGSAPLAPAAALDLPAMLPLTLRRLGDWLRQPVAAHLRDRLGVVFAPLEEALADDEPMALSGLDETILLKALLAARPDAAGGPGEVDSPAALRRGLAAQVQRLARRGELPLGAPGQRWQARFLDMSEPMLQAWQTLQAEHPLPARHRELRFAVQIDGVPTPIVLEDWLDELRLPAGAGAGTGAGADDAPVWLAIDARRLTRTPSQRQPDQVVALPGQLLAPWLRLAAAAACGVPLRGVLVGRDAILRLEPPDPEAARQALAALLEAWYAGLQQPLPVARRSALAWLARLATGSLEDANQAARRAYEDRSGRMPPEVDEPALARCWPDWEALSAAAVPGRGSDVQDDAAGLDDQGDQGDPDDPGSLEAAAFGHWAACLYGPLCDWVEQGVTAEKLPGARPGPDEGDAAGPDGASEAADES